MWLSWGSKRRELVCLTKYNTTLASPVKEAFDNQAIQARMASGILGTGGMCNPRKICPCNVDSMLLQHRQNVVLHIRSPAQVLIDSMKHENPISLATISHQTMRGSSCFKRRLSN